MPTALSGTEPNKTVNEFEIEEESINTCPAGEAPINCEYNEEKETFRAEFDRQACESCPRREECPVKLTKKKAVVQLTRKTITRAALAEAMTTEEYKELARKRNGVEGVPSVMRRKYGVDDMPVRGLARSKIRFGFKIGAMNARRVIEYIQKINIFCFFNLKNHLKRSFATLCHFSFCFSST